VFGFTTQPQGVFAVGRLRSRRAPPRRDRRGGGGRIGYGPRGVVLSANGIGVGWSARRPVLVPGAQFLNVVGRRRSQIATAGSTSSAASTRNSQGFAVFPRRARSGLAFHPRLRVRILAARQSRSPIWTRDGMLDIVTGDYASGTVSVLLGQRSAPGNVLPRAAAVRGETAGAGTVAVADFRSRPDGSDVATGKPERRAREGVLSKHDHRSDDRIRFSHKSLFGRRLIGQRRGVTTERVSPPTSTATGAPRPFADAVGRRARRGVAILMSSGGSPAAAGRRSRTSIPIRFVVADLNGRRPSPNCRKSTCARPASRSCRT